MSEISFVIPPAADTPFLFARAFLGAIRTAISQAQIAGEIDAPTAVACFKAMPAPSPDNGV